MTYFKSVLEVGDLYLDKILFEFDKIPMIFVCKDQKKNYYFCLCTDVIIDYTWMITKVSRETMLKLLLDEISILEIFKRSSEPLIIAEQQGNRILYQQRYFTDIPEEELPDENEKLENPYISDYVERIKSELKLECEYRYSFLYEDRVSIEFIKKNHQNDFVKRMWGYSYVLQKLWYKRGEENFSSVYKQKNNLMAQRKTVVCVLKMTQEGNIEYLPREMGGVDNYLSKPVRKERIKLAY